MGRVKVLSKCFQWRVGPLDSNDSYHMQTAEFNNIRKVIPFHDIPGLGTILGCISIQHSCEACGEEISCCQNPSHLPSRSLSLLFALIDNPIKKAAALMTKINAKIMDVPLMRRPAPVTDPTRMYSALEINQAGIMQLVAKFPLFYLSDPNASALWQNGFVNIMMSIEIFKQDSTQTEDLLWRVDPPLRQHLLRTRSEALRNLKFPRSPDFFIIPKGHQPIATYRCLFEANISPFGAIWPANKNYIEVTATPAAIKFILDFIETGIIGSFEINNPYLARLLNEPELYDILKLARLFHLYDFINYVDTVIKYSVDEKNINFLMSVAIEFGLPSTKAFLDSFIQVQQNVIPFI